MFTHFSSKKNKEGFFLYYIPKAEKNTPIKLYGFERKIKHSYSNRNVWIKQPFNSTKEVQLIFEDFKKNTLQNLQAFPISPNIFSGVNFFILSQGIPFFCEKIEDEIICHRVKEEKESFLEHLKTICAFIKQEKVILVVRKKWHSIQVGFIKKIFHKDTKKEEYLSLSDETSFLNDFETEIDEEEISNEEEEEEEELISISINKDEEENKEEELISPFTLQHSKKEKYSLGFEEFGSIPFSSGFDCFKTTIFKGKPYLLGLETSTGNCQLVELFILSPEEHKTTKTNYEEDLFAIKWEGQFKNIEDIALCVIHDTLNIICLFRNNNDKTKTSKFFLEIRQFQFTNNHNSSSFLVTKRIEFLLPEYEEPTDQHLQQPQKKKENHIQAFFIKKRIKELKFSATITPKKKIRVVLYDGNQELAIDGFLELNSQELEKKSKIYSMLNDTSLTVQEKYRKIKLTVNETNPLKDIPNLEKPKTNAHKEGGIKKRIWKYIQEKEELLNDNGINDVVIDTISSNLSSSIQEKKEPHTLQIIETTLDLFYSINSCFCCYFSNFHFFSTFLNHHNSSRSQFSVYYWFLIVFNYVTCGLLFYFYDLYANTFIFLPFSSEKQKKKKKNISVF